MHNQFFDQFRQAGEDLFRLRLTTSHGGNMSLRHQGKVLITAHFAVLGHLEPADILEISIKDEPDRLDGNASRDTPLHQLIYKFTPAMAIVHAHPAHAVARSFTSEMISPMDMEGSVLLREIPVVTTEKAHSVLPQLLQSHVAAIVRGHGSYAVGRTLGEALAYTSALEFSCKVGSLAAEPQ